MTPVCRRRFLAALCTSALVPRAMAQPKGKVWRIVYLHISTQETAKVSIDNFRKAFLELGYVEGQHYVLEPRYGDNDPARLPVLADEIVRSKPDLILANLANAALAMKKATSTIPIVFSAGDPVGSGLVDSLARPGGNLTGISAGLTDVAPKQFDLLHEAFPKASLVAVLMNPAYDSHRTVLASLQAQAPRLGVKVLVAEAGSQQEIERAFELIARQKAQALLVVGDAIYADRRGQIVALANRAKIACVGNTRDAEGGFVLGYSPTGGELGRKTAELVHKILGGAKPADLPVSQATRFDLVVNLKAARAIGLEIHQSLLLRADRVIE